jgi:hypothetical protein
MLPVLALSLAAALLPGTVSACNHDSTIQRRAVNAARPQHLQQLERRATADRTTEAGEATITDPSQECTYYSNDAANLVVSLLFALEKTARMRGRRQGEKTVADYPLTDPYLP